VETPKSLGQAVSQTRDLLRGLTASQRLLLAGGTVLVGATLWMFVGLIGKPKYATLYSGLKPEEAQQLAGRLAAKNISYELSPDGTSLLVPADQLDASRLQTASQGLPRNARLGFELFDAPNWAGSDFTEKVNYQRALEGELERTLQTLSEVEAVRVHLAMPRESLFREEEHEAKAAVIVKTRSGRLSEQAQAAIPQLVASAVDGLRPENVTVVDADSNTPLLRHDHSDGNYGGSDLDQTLAKTLLQTLEPIVGAEHVRASVHVEYDLSSSDNTEEVYDPKTPVTLTQQKSEESMGGAAPAGVPGTPSNVPGSAAPQTALAAAETQTSRSESETFAVSKSVRHTTQPPGRVKRIAAAVLVDDAVDVSEKDPSKVVRRKRTPEELKEIEQLAGAAIGLDLQRGDLLAVQNLSFQEMPVEKPSPPGKLEIATRMLNQWAVGLRYVGVTLLFLAVYWLVLRPVKKQVLATFRELPTRMARGGKELAGAAVAGVGTVDIELPAGNDQAQRATALKHQLVERVKTEPAAASRLVQNWIREGNKQ